MWNYMWLQNLTYKTIEELDPDYYILKTSYNSLKVYELLFEILKLRGEEVVLPANQPDFTQLKVEILTKLQKVSTKNEPETVIKEAFYLGMLCTALIHANIPVPNALLQFGQILSKQYQNTTDAD